MLRIGGQMLRICRLSGGGGGPKGWAELIWGPTGPILTLFPPHSLALGE